MVVLGYLYNLLCHKRRTPGRRGSSAFVGEYSRAEELLVHHCCQRNDIATFTEPFSYPSLPHFFLNKDSTQQLRFVRILLYNLLIIKALIRLWRIIIFSGL